MDFGDVIKAMKNDHKEAFARKGWNGKGMWIALFMPESEITDGDMEYEMQPFIVMKTAQGTLVPWLASQTDMLADDWEAVQ